MTADQGYDPRTGRPVGEPVPHTGAAELDRLCRAAAAAAPALAALPPAGRAALLRAAAAALGEHAGEIVALADAETALGEPRLAGELARTRAQLAMFADGLEEGSYLEAIIDLPDPAAQPAPRPDLRRLLLPVGPVAVYAASNFPLAFSVAGGDTASALAAGCPVVVKAHPGHPGLSVRCGQIVARALAGAGAPAGSFAVVHGFDTGRALVAHPAIAAAGFTGSLAGGRELFALAGARPDPIPFYGELGALNPVVVTAGALAARAGEIVTGFTGSFTLGSGQFCTKPGVVFLPAGHGLADRLAAAVRAAGVGPLLAERIRSGYVNTAAGLAAVPGVRSLLGGAGPAGPGWQVAPQLLAVAAPALVERADELLVECFGPAALLVEYASTGELLAGLDALPGSLTGTLHADLATEAELAGAVVDRLTARAGRVIVGGWPTGVAVSWAMHHGGPWPATTNPGHTSVGATAIRRFQRPVVYQDTPAELLPPPLRDGNPWRVPRRVDGTVTAGPIPPAGGEPAGGEPAGGEYDEPLRRAAAHVTAWLDELPTRQVTASATAEQVGAALGDQLPDGPTAPAEVVDLLATAATPGLVATPSGRFFGFVIGGTLPAALAADWLVSAWDQNFGLRVLSPANAAIDDIAAAWLLDLLGLPAEAAVGFVTGGTMANFTGLAAARDALLGREGWEVGHRGLAGAPRVRVLVGAERHDTVDLALRYLGLGEPEVVAADPEGRVRVDALATALRRDRDRPTILCLQAGNLHSGACDPFAEAVPLAREAGAWVHVDGAFGLWAAASPTTRGLTAGVETADSWATDAHKTLNVPYDCGVVIVRDPAAMRAAMSVHGDYLITDDTRLEPYERVPELSRRARAVPLWAALRSLGRTGVAELVDRLCRQAAALAAGARRIPGVEVLNEVVFTQVCLWFGTDERTREVGRRLLADGTVWMTGSRWRGREVLRISVSNWSTDEADVAASLAALRRAADQAA